MKPSEVPINQSYLLRHSGKDVTWSCVYEYTNLQFSKDKKAVLVCIDKRAGAAKYPGGVHLDNTSIHWKSVSDLDEKFEVFDLVE